MKHLRQVIAFAVMWLLASLPAYADDLSIGNYTLVSSQRLSRTLFEYVYKASVTNTGDNATNVTASLNGWAANITVVDGSLTFGDVAANSTVQSSDTFTVHINRTALVTEADFQWDISADSSSLSADFLVKPPTGEAPFRAIFTPKPTTTAAINQYAWDLDGDGTPEIFDSVGRDVFFTYTAPGSYLVSLKVTESSGDIASRSRTINVINAPPVVMAEAQPSNGPVPLAVNFFVTATDNEGIAKYEWDFQGDGTFDYTSTTTGNTNFTYTNVGTYNPVLRVTDNLGAPTIYTGPTTVVRATAAGTPSVTATASPTLGNVPLTVSLNGSGNDPNNHAFVSWAWDFEGDGVFDSTAATADRVFQYTSAGTYFPRLRGTTDDNRTAEDVVQVTVHPVFTLQLSTDTIDPGLGETLNVITSLGGTTRVSLIIEKRDGTLVRTLVPFVTRPGGSYTDPWDGKNDDSLILPEGDYYAILLYETPMGIQRFDLGLTTGGSQYNPPRSSIPAGFSPFAGDPLEIDFTLNNASEVTAFIGRFNVDTRLVTFMQRQPLGKGTYHLVWNGENGDGQLIQPPPGDSFLFGIFGYTFPSNGAFVRNGVQISGLSASPSIFDPTGMDDSGQPERSHISFTLSKPATVELLIQDTTSGAVLGRLQYPGLDAGANTILWDGKVYDGLLAAPGRYRLGVTAIEPSGFKSLTLYTLQRIFY